MDVWQFKKKEKSDDFEYTKEEKEIIDKASKYTGSIVPCPSDIIIKIIRKQIDLQQKFDNN